MWKKITLSFFCLTLLINSASAEVLQCPNYSFERNLVQGNSGEDVRLLQKILNADRRTSVAFSGAGSPGKETSIFGKATRESLKRFQALFIEYVGIADGKLNQKTRGALNLVCKGPYFTNGTGKVYDVNKEVVPNNTNTTPLVVAMAGPSTYVTDTPFQAYLASNKAIKTPSITSLIISGASAQSFRKISSTTYSFLVVPNEDVRDTITFQMEADAVEDSNNNRNINASNEWVVTKISTPLPATTTSPFPLSTSSTNTNPFVYPDYVPPTIDFPTIGDFKITNGRNLDCSRVASVSVTDYSNPCYGRTSMVPDPNTGANTSQTSNSSGGSSGGGSGLVQNIMMGLVGALLLNTVTGGAVVSGISSAASSVGSAIGSLFSSGIYGGGVGSVPGVCVCKPTTVPPGTLLGVPTIHLLPLPGSVMIPGRYLMEANPGIGKFLGTVFPAPIGVCGQSMVLLPNGVVKCVLPFSDSTGIPITGLIPPPPAFIWGF